jgi:hypothetical protein
MSIVPGWGPRALARLGARAAGTLQFPRSLNQAGRGASARSGTEHRRGRRRAGDGKRSWTSSQAGPKAWRSLVSRLHSMRRADSAGFHREYPVLLSEYPAVRYRVWHRGALHCAQVGQTAAQPMQDEAGLRHARPHLFLPSALHLRAAWLPASTQDGQANPVWRAASIRHWLRAGRLPALAPASLRAAVRALARTLARIWSGGRWERTPKRKRPSRKQVHPGEPLPGSFSAWVSAALETGGKPPSPPERIGWPAKRIPVSRFPGSGRSARPWRAREAGAWPTSRGPLPAPASARLQGKERSRSLRW